MTQSPACPDQVRRARCHSVMFRQNSFSCRHHANPGAAAVLRNFSVADGRSECEVVMGSTAEIQILHENNLINMNCYSQSTHSLPALGSSRNKIDKFGTMDNFKRFQSVADVQEKRKIVHQFSKTDLDSIENVCNFINNNSEPNLMELPGLKIKQKASIPIHEQIPSALRLKIFVHEEKVLKTTLKSKDMTVQNLMSSVFHKLRLTESESSHLCLCKRVEDEFFYIPSSEKVLDQSTNMFYLRLIKPLNSSLRSKLYDSKFDVRNCGNFAYKGRTNKKSDSSCIKMVVNSSGIELNCDFILWKYVSQVSYSATFLQILYKHNQGLAKKKVCFETEKIKPIYEIIMHFVEVEKIKKAQAVVVERVTEPEAVKPKEGETKFDNFCKKICSFTKDAVKSIGTPRRKRSKSIDSHTYQKPKKTKALNRSLSSADMNRVKRNIFEEFSEATVSAPMSSSTPVQSVSVKRKSETQLDQAPIKRTKIVTNPRVSEKENQGSSSSQSQPQPQVQPQMSSSSSTKKIPGRTPVRMGVRTIATSSKPLPVMNPIPTEERKIFYTTALKTDFAYFGIRLKLNSIGVYVDNIERNNINCKFHLGDRLLAINGISLENCRMEKAEHLLEISGQFVNFIISRKIN